MMNVNEFETLETIILEHLPGETPAWRTLANWLDAWRTNAQNNADWDPNQTVHDWLGSLNTCWRGMQFDAENSVEITKINNEYDKVFQLLSKELNRFSA